MPINLSTLSLRVQQGVCVTLMWLGPFKVSFFSACCGCTVLWRDTLGEPKEHTYWINV